MTLEQQASGRTAMTGSVASPKAPNVATKITAVRQRYAVARKQLRDSEAEELQRLQNECGASGHHWKWHQVAGDGRYCEICDAQDITAD